MPTFSQKIELLKVLGWTLRVVAGFLLIVMAISVITSLPNITPSSPNAQSNVDSLIITDLYLLISVGVTAFISTVVFSAIKHQEDDLDAKLLGYVTSNYQTNLAALAAWLNLTQRETADRLARLVSAREVYGVNIDLANGTITQGVLPVAESEADQLQESGLSPSVPAPNTTMQNVPVPAESDEATKIKAKLYELEVLRQQGKIGIPAYNKLKEDYETKLAQVDTGTKVY